MGTNLKFKIIRAALIAFCVSSIATTLIWYATSDLWPGQYSWFYFLQGRDTRLFMWMHTGMYYLSAVSFLDFWFFSGGLEQLIESRQYNFDYVFIYITYPIITIIVLSSLASLFLLYLSRQNRNALMLGSSLALWSWFLAYTFILRVHLLVNPGVLLITSDVLNSISLVGSMFLFSRFFTNYPEKLDFAECTSLTHRTGKYESKPKFKFQQRLKEIIIKWDPFINTKLYQGNYEGTWAIYDSVTFLKISIIAFILASILSYISKIFLYKLWVIISTIMFFAITMAFILNAGFKLFAQYRLGSEKSRRQIEWLHLSLFGTVVLFSTTLITGFVIRWIGIFEDPSKAGESFLFPMLFFVTPILGFITFLLALLMSMFYRGAIDPKLLIRKSTIYTLIAIIMTITFVLIEATISSTAIVHLGLPSQTGALAAATFTALVFMPLRTRIEGGVNRFVDRMLPASALAEGKRYETVVAYADLGGYIQAIETDEEQALTAASLFHKQGQKAAGKYKGRVVKRIGDALLLEFASVDTAVAALNFFYDHYHQHCREQQLPHLPIHTGVHVGMVVKARDGDIYGSTVNIAAKLEGVAGPDEIILSDKAKQKLETDNWPFTNIGAQQLKNLPEPILCYKLA